MAFSIAVSKGDDTIESCPYIEKKRIEQLSKSIKKTDVFEKIYESLKQEVIKINLCEVAEGIGAETIEDGIKIVSMGREFLVKNNGEIVSEGKANIWAKILLLIYIKTGGTGQIKNQWISFSDLKGGAIKIEAIKKEAEKPLTELFRREPDYIIKILNRLGAEDVKGQPADYAWRFFLLPKIPVLILYWKPDEEFPPNVKLLFDSTADFFLDVESLVFLCEGFVKMLEQMIKASK